MWPFQLKRGLQPLWDMMFSQEVLDKVGQVGRDIVMVLLPVMLLPESRLLVQLMDSFDVVLLVNSLTI
jgi:hypothetical protein